MYIITRNNKLLIDRCSVLKLLLLAVWTSGLLLGIYSVRYIPDVYFSMMRSLLFQRMSIVGRAVGLIFPFVITAILHLYFKSQFIPILAFIKSYTFGLFSGSVCWLFGSGSWLVHWLLCFSGWVCNICLLYLWLQYFNCPRSGNHRNYLRIGFVMAVVFLFDLLVISPFSVRLF